MSWVNQVLAIGVTGIAFLLIFQAGLVRSLFAVCLPSLMVAYRTTCLCVVCLARVATSKRPLAGCLRTRRGFCRRGQHLPAFRIRWRERFPSYCVTRESRRSQGFPLFSLPFVHNLGMGASMSIIGGVSVLLAFVPFLFWKYGRRCVHSLPLCVSQRSKKICSDYEKRVRALVKTRSVIVSRCATVQMRRYTIEVCTTEPRETKQLSMRSIRRVVPRRFPPS